MDTEKLPGYLRHIGRTLENKIADALTERDPDKKEGGAERSELPPMRSEGMEFEPDWDEIDRKANLIVARYTAISTAANVLPFGADVVAVTAVFTKMTTELAGVYQVIMSNKRARQMGWAIATTTGTVMGAVVAGSRLAKLVPGGYFVGVAVQAPLVGVTTWAAGDTLKDYFKQTRKGREPGIEALRDSFAKTLRIRLKKVKVAEPTAAVPDAAATAATVAAAPATVMAPPQSAASDALEKIAMLHELLRSGAITQAEFDATKAELLSKL
jgi:uncharacterized protein (DUF697 family)